MKEISLREFWEILRLANVTKEVGYNGLLGLVKIGLDEMYDMSRDISYKEASTIIEKELFGGDDK